MRLPDFGRSRAVISGTAHYESQNLTDLPSVANSIRGLREILIDTKVAGFPKGTCNQIIDPPDPGALLGPIAEAAGEAEDTLLLYFAGHGLLLNDGELHLGLTTTHDGEFWTAVPFEQVARIIRGSDALSKVLILDCCYSGRAMNSIMADPSDVAGEQLEVEGLYVMTSSSATKTSLAPEGAKFTAFTGTLLDTINTGVANGDPLLRMEILYEETRRRMKMAGMRVPQQRNGNTVGSLALVRNVAFDKDAPQTEIPGLDMSRSGAVVIGTSRYDSQQFPPLPSAANDANDVAKALADPAISGIGAMSIVVDAQSIDSVLDVTQTIARDVRDTMILYVSGHSWINSAGELQLVLPSSDVDRPWTLMPVRFLSEILLASLASSTVVIVDTSYAMRMAQCFEQASNLYFLAASGPNHHAYVSTADERGEFTDSVLAVLREGIPGAPEHLSPVDLFRAVENTGSRGGPRLAIYNAGRPPCLYYNRSKQARSNDTPHRCS